MTQQDLGGTQKGDGDGVMFEFYLNDLDPVPHDDHHDDSNHCQDDMIGATVTTIRTMMVIGT